MYILTDTNKDTNGRFNIQFFKSVWLIENRGMYWDWDPGYAKKKVGMSRKFLISCSCKQPVRYEAAMTNKVHVH